MKDDLLDLYRTFTVKEVEEVYAAKKYLDDAIALLQLASQFSNCTRYQAQSLAISLDFLRNWRDLYQDGIRSGNPVFFRKLFNLEKVSDAMSDIMQPPFGREHDS